MKSIFMGVITLMTAVSFAHVEPGKYVGKTAAGAACEMVAGETYFENSTPHPLNERIKIQFDGAEYLVGHPPVVDVKTDTAYFNHDIFQGVLPTTTGAKALIIDMVHTDVFEGPARFHVIENKWKTGEKSVLVCDGITLVK